MCLIIRYHQEQRESFRLIRAWHFGTFVENAGVQYAQILLSNHLLTHIYDSIWECMKIMSELDPRNRQNLHFSKSVGVILGHILSRPWGGHRPKMKFKISSYTRDIQNLQEICTILKKRFIQKACSNIIL